MTAPRGVLLAAMLLLALTGSASAARCRVEIALADPFNPETPTQVLPLNLMEVTLYKADGTQILPMFDNAPENTRLSSTWTSSYDPAPGLVVFNCFDGNTGTMCATAAADRNPSLKIFYDCPGGVVDLVDKVVITNRPNAATGRCVDCGNRIRQFAVNSYDAFGNTVNILGPLRFDFWSGPPLGLSTYTFYLGLGLSQCYAEIYKRPVTNPAYGLYINLREITLRDGSGKPYAPEELTIGMSSTFSPARLYKADNLFDNNFANFASTGLGDASPWLKMGYPCNRGILLEPNTFYNRLNYTNGPPPFTGCPSCMSRITNFLYRTCTLFFGTCNSANINDIFTEAKATYI